MKNDEAILSEIKKLGAIVERLVGTVNSEANEKFSSKSLDNAAKEFQKLLKQREEWIDEQTFDKQLKASHYTAGKVVREEFGFTGYYKKGYKFFYKKDDIVALAKELKTRNIDLGRYVELRKDQTNFEKCVEVARGNASKTLTMKPFHIPEELNNILTSAPKLPELDKMKEELQKLKDEFHEKKFSDYIDIYKDNYAMAKHVYHFEKYLEPTIKRRIFRWCDEFNVVNRILHEITGKKEKKFIPVPEKEMIRL